MLALLPSSFFALFFLFALALAAGVFLGWFLWWYPFESANTLNKECEALEQEIRETASPSAGRSS